MNTTKTLTCIGCPLGCCLEAEIKDNKVFKVSGNGCVRGKAYAESECVNPTRILTSSIPVINGSLFSVSVKTDAPIPKSLIFECVKLLNGIEVKAPVKIGDIIVKNIRNTDVNIVATKNVEII